MTVKKAPKNYDAKVKLAFAAYSAYLLFQWSPVFSLFLGVADVNRDENIYDLSIVYGSTLCWDYY